MIALALIIALAAADAPPPPAADVPPAWVGTSSSDEQARARNAKTPEDDEIVRNLDLLEKIDLLDGLDLLDEDADAKPHPPDRTTAVP